VTLLSLRLLLFASKYLLSEMFLAAPTLREKEKSEERKEEEGQ
jgi:hypothetical protein